jgi:hypothetical protein
MKTSFLRLLYAAAAAEVAGSQPVVSEKLTALKAQYTAAWQTMLTMTDPFSKETKDAKLAVWKIEGEIKAEEAAIQKQANDAKVAEMRNQRLQLNAKQLEAYSNLLAAKADKKTPADRLAELETAFATAKELVDNELLAKYAASSTAKKAATPTDGTPSDGKSNANTAAIVELYLAGKSHKEIEEAGYKRSTVWHAINNYKKANNIA